MSDDNKNPSAADLESLKSVYKICIETRNFEINQLLQRNNFFMLFQGILIAAALQNQASKPMVEFIICLTGVIVSWYQMQVSAGAKFWQEWWESRVAHYEKELRKIKSSQSGHFYELFDTNLENVRKEVCSRRKYGFINSIIMQAYSVGSTPIKVSIVLLLAWAFLLIHSIDFSFFNGFLNFIKGFDFNGTTK